MYPTAAALFCGVFDFFWNNWSILFFLNRKQYHYNYHHQNQQNTGGDENNSNRFAFRCLPDLLCVKILMRNGFRHFRGFLHTFRGSFRFLCFRITLTLRFRFYFCSLILGGRGISGIIGGRSGYIPGAAAAGGTGAGRGWYRSGQGSIYLGIKLT